MGRAVDYGYDGKALCCDTGDKHQQEPINAQHSGGVPEALAPGTGVG